MKKRFPDRLSQHCTTFDPYHQLLAVTLSAYRSICCLFQIVLLTDLVLYFVGGNPCSLMQSYIGGGPSPLEYLAKIAFLFPPLLRSPAEKLYSIYEYDFIIP